jgi:Ca2+-binding EF-hand superfamily protein
MEGLPFLGGSPVRGGHKVGTKSHKAASGKTVAERIAWMSRTSDVVGSFHNMSAEANTNLIRRKIQERCGNTQELMAAIRRLKTGDTGHVTPTEFRLTMIKFGISIPQSLCDTIFTLFDSDRSGTIDFDEFAMWIMNSEFRPVKKGGGGGSGGPSPEELLRQRLQLCLDQFPEVFATMKKRISFLDLSADVIRKEMPMTEKDARHLFKILDPHNTGLIDSAMLKRYGRDGITESIPTSSSGPFNPMKHFSSSSGSTRPDLQESIFKICGRNTNLLLDCFVNYDENTQLQYDEFRCALLSHNLGVNPKDTQNLFLALDGQKGVCDLSILIRTVKPTPLDPASVVSLKVRLKTSLLSSVFLTISLPL